MIKVSSISISVKAIFLLCLLMPSILFSQTDSMKTHHLEDVAIFGKKPNYRLLLQKIIKEKQQMIRDTQIAYMLIQKDAVSQETDTLSRIVILDFKQQELKNAYFMHYFDVKNEARISISIAIYSIANRFAFLKGSSAFNVLFLGKGVVELTTVGTRMEFKDYGSGSLKDSIMSNYQFDDYKDSEMAYYYNHQNYQESGVYTYFFHAGTVLPYRISITDPKSDYNLYFEAIPIDLSNKKLNPIILTKPLRTYLTP